ncbi:MAG: hypothetical protein ACE367_07015 [Acidimicrobiales bacterium]
MESPTLRFAATARILTEAARRSGHRAPTFRSPPRVKGRMRTIRRHANGGATVSLVLRDRPWSAVVSDMIEGFVVVNDVDPMAAERLRDLLWASVEEIDVRVDRQPGASVTDLAGISEPPLRIVDAA